MKEVGSDLPGDEVIAEPEVAMNGTSSHDIDLDEATEEVSFVGFSKVLFFFCF